MKIALHSRLHQGQEHEYERQHRVVPEELADALVRSGIREWTIWRSGLDLFHLLDVDDFDAAMAQMDDEPANVVWQARMASLVSHFEVDADGAMPMAHVGSLSDQLGPDLDGAR